MCFSLVGLCEIETGCTCCMDVAIYIGMPYFSVHRCYATVQKGRFPFSFHSGFSLNAGFWHSVCKGDHEKFNFNEINNSDIIIAQPKQYCQSF